MNNVNMLMRMIAEQKLYKGAMVIDATLGNGKDIEYLLDIVGEEGFAYGFDIQEVAIENTIVRLKNKNVEYRYRLIRDGHENMDAYVDEEIDFIVFNLGYLPKGDHNLVTKPKTTITAIDKALNILKKNGCICISSYISHDGGLEEYYFLKEYLSKLDQKLYNIIEMKFINQKNDPPCFFVVEKRL